MNSKYYSGGKIITCRVIYENMGAFENKVFEHFKKNRIKHPTYIINKKSDGRTEWFNVSENCLFQFIDSLIYV